ncbi:MAG: hypothetical protein JWM47_1050 [Acidimicrobiales bacterium]|nr:hypothetical protein [Acidimicrobiales bacterium]
MADEPQPRTTAGSRAGREQPAPARPPRVPREEPVIDIRPPAWFVAVARVAAVVYALLAVVAAVAGVVTGSLVSAIISLLGGTALAVMAFDASNRSATSTGDDLVLHQWFRSRTLERPEVLEFESQRASFFRWDIVAVPVDGTQVRLWVTRMLPAGRVRRQAWLAELESWRTWVGPSAGPDGCT